MQAPATSTEPTRDHDRLLAIYLEDHRAGAAAGRSLAQRMLDANPNNYLTGTLRDLVDAITRDCDVLDDIIRRLGLSPNRWKMAAGKVGEWAGRLKANGRLRRYSPLSRLEEFELLRAGIMTKASLWKSGAQALARRAELVGVDFAALVQEAERQAAALEAHRSRIVDDALGR